jgi:hypothetical protein
MKLKEKINIDFEEFFATGKFDFLKLGKTKEWIINNFPDPDGFDEHPEVFKDDIWRYGNIELHFNNDELFLIFSDYINGLDGGDSLELKKWFLVNTDMLKLSDIISQLNTKHIDFQKRTNNIGQTTVNLELQSGVGLGFHLEEKIDEDYEEFLERCKNTNQDEFRLGSFSLMKK